MDYVRKGEDLDSRRNSVYPVECRSSRSTVNAERLVIIYGFWNKHMEQWGKRVVLRS